MPTPDTKPVDLAQRLADPAFRAQIEQAVAAMPPERAAELVHMLEQSLHRRKIEMIGYLAAAIVLLIGMVVALYVFGTSGGSSFIGWVFLVPLALAGLVMIVVGRVARSTKRARHPHPTP
jgi:peptidoglycan/LPS O-acetylase OafA/YrhL